MPGAVARQSRESAGRLIDLGWTPAYHTLYPGVSGSGERVVEPEFYRQFQRADGIAVILRLRSPADGLANLACVAERGRLVREGVFRAVS